jgi:hypothetical protein
VLFRSIRVNCVAPGAVWDKERFPDRADIPFVKQSIPAHRVGDADEIGEAVAYMAGAKYVTGTTLLVDGGLSLPGLLEGRDHIPWKTEEWAEKRFESAMQMLADEKR